MNSVQGDPESSLSQTTRQDDRIPSQQPDRTPQPSSIIEDHEEGRAAYRPGGFHPVYIGDVFSDRFKVLNKIGYGRYSTVWLVRDLQVRSAESCPPPFSLFSLTFSIIAMMTQLSSVP